jgi:sugar (pentulose or hexulose) kinase
LPAFSDQGGPFASRKGVIKGETPTTPKARSALATLYSALMTAHMLRRLEAPGDLIVEGGFTRSPAFAAVLARLMPGRRVVIAPMSAGAAAGAAMLAHWDEPHPSPRLEPARTWNLPGLEAYQDRWERAL